MIKDGEETLRLVLRCLGGLCRDSKCKGAASDIGEVV